MEWKAFLIEQANQCGLPKDCNELFVEMFSDDRNKPIEKPRSNEELSKRLHFSIADIKTAKRPKIFQSFASTYSDPVLNGKDKGKALKLLEILKEEYEKVNQEERKKKQELMKKEQSTIKKENEKVSSLLFKQEDIGIMNNLINGKKSNDFKFMYSSLEFQIYCDALGLDIPKPNFFIDDSQRIITKGNYLVFDERWKQFLFQWLQQDDVPQEDKEEVLKRLLRFDDDCGFFYNIQANSLAAECLKYFEVQSSLADVLLDRLIRWAFGDFDKSEDQCTDYLSHLTKGARAALLNTDYKRVIPKLEEKLLEVEQHKPSRAGIIQEHLQQIKKADNEAKNNDLENQSYIHWRKPDNSIDEFDLEDISSCVEKWIAKELPIETLCDPEKGGYWENIFISQGVTDLRVFAQMLLFNEPCKFLQDILSEVPETLQKAIATLAIYLQYQIVKLAKLSNSRNNRAEIAKRLSKLSEKYPIVIGYILYQLSQRLKMASPPEIKLTIAGSLGVIANHEPEALQTITTALKELNQSSDNLYLQELSGKILEEIQFCLDFSINILVSLIPLVHCESVLQIAKWLSDIGYCNHIVINALKEIMMVTLKDNGYQIEELEDINYSFLGIYWGANNSQKLTLIEELRDKILSREYIWYFWFFLNIDVKEFPSSTVSGTVADELFGMLGQVAELVETPKVLQRLIEISKYDQSLVNSIFEEMQERLETGYVEIFEGLEEVLYPEILPSIVSFFKEEWDQCDQITEILWHCSKQMSYSDFYDAWCSDYKPIEVKEVKELDFANLPQEIDNYITQPSPEITEQFRIVYVNTNQFVDPENPTLDIYCEMVNAGCPRSCDRTPKTLSELKAYWKLEVNQDKRITVLVLYDPDELGFNLEFLQQLNCFKEAICIISNQDHQYKNLESLSVSDSALLESFVYWLFKLQT